jgi:hypothetical protein
MEEETMNMLEGFVAAENKSYPDARLGDTVVLVDSIECDEIFRKCKKGTCLHDKPHLRSAYCTNHHGERHTCRVVEQTMHGHTVRTCSCLIVTRVKVSGQLIYPDALPLEQRYWFRATNNLIGCNSKGGCRARPVDAYTRKRLVDWIDFHNRFG